MLVLKQYGFSSVVPDSSMDCNQRICIIMITFVLPIHIRLSSIVLACCTYFLKLAGSCLVAYSLDVLKLIGANSLLVPTVVITYSKFDNSFIVNIFGVGISLYVLSLYFVHNVQSFLHHNSQLDPNLTFS